MPYDGTDTCLSTPETKNAEVHTMPDGPRGIQDVRPIIFVPQANGVHHSTLICKPLRWSNCNWVEKDGEARAGIDYWQESAALAWSLVRCAFPGGLSR